MRHRDGQKGFQGYLDPASGEPAWRACVSLVVACQAAAPEKSIAVEDETESPGASEGLGVRS